MPLYLYRKIIKTSEHFNIQDNIFSSWDIVWHIYVAYFDTWYKYCCVTQRVFHYEKKGFHVKVDPYLQYEIEKFFCSSKKKFISHWTIICWMIENANPLLSADRESGCIPQFFAKWIVTIDRCIKGNERAIFLWIAIW